MRIYMSGVRMRCVLCSDDEGGVCQVQMQNDVRMSEGFRRES